MVASMDVGNGKMSRANQLHKKNLGQPGVLVQFAQRFLQIFKHIYVTLLALLDFHILPYFPILVIDSYLIS